MLRLGVGGAPEKKRIETRDGARTHCEDVAQDAAHSGRRALIGFDVTGVIVAFHLEYDCKPVTDIDHPGVFSGSLDNPGRLRRQRAQMNLGGFVGAVLVPHCRKDTELRVARQPADQSPNAFVLFRRNAVGGNYGRSDSCWLARRAASRSGRARAAPRLRLLCRAVLSALLCKDPFCKDPASAL